MKKVVIYSVTVFFFSCGNHPDPVIPTSTDTLKKFSSSNAYATPAAQDTVALMKPKTEKIKNPVGIYHVILPYNESSRIEQTVKFYTNNTYRLQETFSENKKDSTVVTEGTWAPSNGYIWLYKEQVVGGRYKWKGDTLQYFNPRYNKNYKMHKLSDVLGNNVWKNKKNEGSILFGVGNEPFWSIEFNNKDTLSFLLSEWKSPLKMKIAEATTGKDTTIYLAQNDSIRLKVIVLPFFCSDGMSNYVYQNKIQVQYNNQTYSGCGILYK